MKKTIAALLILCSNTANADNIYLHCKSTGLVAAKTNTWDYIINLAGKTVSETITVPTTGHTGSRDGEAFETPTHINIRFWNSPFKYWEDFSIDRSTLDITSPEWAEHVGETIRTCEISSPPANNKI